MNYDHETAEALNSLRKQCEELRQENLKMKTVLCTDATFTCLHHTDKERESYTCGVCLAKERDDLRTRAEKAEAEVAELKANNRYQKGYAAGEKETMDQLSQLQQDVRPLVSLVAAIFKEHEEYGVSTFPDLQKAVESYNKALETFLAKHPELKV